MAEDIAAKTTVAENLLQTGQKVGNYRVVRRLGQGGMGAVFEAVHQYIERKAAIKVLLPELSRNPLFSNRFLNEARAVNLIKHPGLVEIFEFGLFENGTAYIVMEFLEGESLGRRMARLVGGLRAEALAIARQIAVALHAAHQKNIVHRDLKPDNVMLVPDPDRKNEYRVKVLDFGIAKLSDQSDGQSRTETGTVIGTPAYMSPEQCLGASTIDGKADVYALGIILYEMVAGHLPFNAKHSFDFMAAHVRLEPRPLHEAVTNIPEEVATLIHSMLAKDSAERPRMEAVVGILDQLLAASSSLWSMGEVGDTGVGAPLAKQSLEFGATVSGEANQGAFPSKQQLGSGATPPAGSSGNLQASDNKRLPAPMAAGLEPAPSLPGRRVSGQLAVAAESVPSSLSSKRVSGQLTPVMAPLPSVFVTTSRWPAWAVLGAGILCVVAAGVFVTFRRAPLPPVTTVAAKAQPEPAIPAKVKWIVLSEPAGAEVVRADGQVLGSTPWEIERPSGSGETRLTLRQPGYQDKSIVLNHSTDVRTNFHLLPVAAPPAISAGEAAHAAAPSKTGGRGKAKKAQPQPEKKSSDRDVKLLLD